MDSIILAIVFVYSNGDEVVVLDHQKALDQQKDLYAKGFKHTHTLNAALWMQNLVKLNDNEKLKQINDLKVAK